MTTHGNTLFIFDDQVRVSQAASDGFLNPYVQSLFNALFSLGEAKAKELLVTSTQLSVDWDTEMFSEEGVEALKRIAALPELEESTWDEYFQFDMSDMTDAETHMDLASALLSVRYAHNFKAQFIAQAFFIFYDAEINIDINAELKDFCYDWVTVVDFNRRAISVCDSDIPVSFTFDEVFASPIDVADVVSQRELE